MLGEGYRQPGGFASVIGTVHQSNACCFRSVSEPVTEEVVSHVGIEIRVPTHTGQAQSHDGRTPSRFDRVFVRYGVVAYAWKSLDFSQDDINVEVPDNSDSRRIGSAQRGAHDVRSVRGQEVACGKRSGAESEYGPHG